MTYTYFAILCFLCIFFRKIDKSFRVQGAYPYIKPKFLQILLRICIKIWHKVGQKNFYNFCIYSCVKHRANIWSEPYVKAFAFKFSTWNFLCNFYLEVLKQTFESKLVKKICVKLLHLKFMRDLSQSLSINYICKFFIPSLSQNLGTTFCLNF